MTEWKPCGDPWTPLAVDYFDDPAIQRAGIKGAALHQASMCEAQARLSDGFIPTESLPMLCAKAFGVPRSTAKVLEREGLWLPVDNGWVIAGWSKWNRPAALVGEEREKRREGARIGNHNRWHRDRGVSDPTCPFCRSTDRSSDRSTDQTSDQSTDQSSDRSTIAQLSLTPSLNDRSAIAQRSPHTHTPPTTDIDKTLVVEADPANRSSDPPEADPPEPAADPIAAIGQVRATLDSRPRLVGESPT